MNLPSYKLREELKINHLLDSYIKEKKIMNFDSKFLNRIKNTNVVMFRDFFQIFEEGLNIGTCGLTVRYLSYLFNDFTIIEDGICEILKNTKGAPNGEHAWLLVNGYVYDTTLMLKIDQEVAYNELGYIPHTQVTSEEIMKDELYMIQRKISKDKSDLKWKRDLIIQLKKSNLKCSLLGVE